MTDLPAGWTEVALADLALQMRDGPFGSNLKSSHYVEQGVRVIRLQNIGVGQFLPSDAAYITKEHFSSLPKHHCQPGDLLIATLGDPNVRACILPTGVPEALNKADCIQLRCDPKVADSRYLMHLINSNRFQHQVAALAHGQTRTRVSMGQLRQASVPLPPLEEQRRIAAILNKAAELRAGRRTVVGQLDELAQSMFIAMFGGRSEWDTRWPTAKLKELCLLSGEYGAGVASVPFDPNLPRYVRITDIDEAGQLSADRVSPGGSATEWGRFLLHEGDILLARSGATVGKSYLHRGGDDEHVFAGYLIRFRPDPSVLDPEFALGFTKSAPYRAWVKSQQRAVAQPNINAKQYGELVLPVPPLPEQRRYSEFCAVVAERQRVALRSERELGVLSASLQSRAFRGEL